MRRVYLLAALLVVLAAIGITTFCLSTRPPKTQPTPVDAKQFVATLPTLINPQAVAPIKGAKWSFQDFKTKGAIAGIAIGDDASKVTSSWGLPASIWQLDAFHVHSYKNVKLTYEANRVKTIDITDPDLAFDNGLTTSTTHPELISTLGEAKTWNSQVTYQVDPKGYNTMEFTVADKDGKFAGEEEDLPKSTIKSVKLQWRTHFPFLASPPPGYAEKLGSLTSPGSMAPIAGDSHAFKDFMEKGAVAGIAFGDSIDKVVSTWGKPMLVSISSKNTIIEYNNAVVTFNDDNKVCQILVGYSFLFRKSDFAFDNGLATGISESTARKILGPSLSSGKFTPSAGKYTLELDFNMSRMPGNFDIFPPSQVLRAVRLTPAR